jgi:hypothetical protein
MQQRRPRLGDILDDYCPRERRVTNHAVVAIVDDDVRQTRCTTCDSEHEYRQAKTPAPRRGKSAAALTQDSPEASRPVLAAHRPPPEPERPAAVVPEEPALPDLPDVSDVPELTAVAAPPAPDPSPDTTLSLDSAAEFGQQEAAELQDPREDDGPVHRRLIRATFPRPEGHVPERREPEFTIRQPGGRGRSEVDGNRVGYRSNSGRNQRHGQQGGHGNFGARQHGGGWGSDGQRGGRGPGGRFDNRQGGGGQNRGHRHGGAGRKNGR